MLKPLAGYVVIETICQEEKTASGIYLPDTASKEKPQTGIILAVGKGVTLDNGSVVEPEVKVGNHVVFAKYVGSEVTLDSKDYLVVKEKDILAIIE